MNIVGAFLPVGKIARATTLVSFEVAEKTRTWKEERKAKKLAAAGLSPQPTGGNQEMGHTVQPYQQPQPQQQYQHQQYQEVGIPHGYGQQQYQYPPPNQHYTYPQPSSTIAQSQPLQPAYYAPPQPASSPLHSPTPPPAYQHMQSQQYAIPQKHAAMDVYQPLPYEA